MRFLLFLSTGNNLAQFTPHKIYKLSTNKSYSNKIKKQLMTYFYFQVWFGLSEIQTKLAGLGLTDSQAELEDQQIPRSVLNSKMMELVMVVIRAVIQQQLGLEQFQKSGSK